MPHPVYRAKRTVHVRTSCHDNLHIQGGPKHQTMFVVVNGVYDDIARRSIYQTVQHFI